MSPRLTGATAVRVLTQIRRDPRTIGLILVIPLLLLTLFWWMVKDLPPLPMYATLNFDVVGPKLMGLFPLIMMFLITSVTTLRERQSGTMERLMASPAGRGDIVLGYMLAFGILATIQGVVVVSFAVWALGMNVAGPLWALMVIIVLDAILGTALGLAASSAARTEFQAVQMMPAIILPQLLIAGLFIPRDQMPTVLHWISDVMPLSYSIDALNKLAASSTASGIWSQVLVLCGFIVGALALGITTLRRRTG
jgi:ABC-2 type transport system permease protein